MKGERKAYVEDEQGILGTHDLTWAERGNGCRLFVPPDIATLSPGNLTSSPLQHDNLLNLGAVLESSVNNSLGGDRLSSTSTFISGDDNARTTVVDTVTERLC